MCNGVGLSLGPLHVQRRETCEKSAAGPISLARSFSFSLFRPNGPTAPAAAASDADEGYIGGIADIASEGKISPTGASDGRQKTEERRRRHSCW